MKVAVSCGDVNGIGLEVFFSSLRDHAPASFREQNIELVLIAEPRSLYAYAAQMRVSISSDEDPTAAQTPAESNKKPQESSPQDSAEVAPRLAGHLITIHGHSLHLLPCHTQARLRFGELHADAGALALEALERAADLALAGAVDAILTLPVNKKALHLAGADFPGQTEFFARRAVIHDPMMILCTRQVRVGLATIHIPVSQVAASITNTSVKSGIRRLAASLQRDFGIRHPKIAVLGLNPHAGEDGDIGAEELQTIIPSIESIRAQGVIGLSDSSQSSAGAQSALNSLTLAGPFPADGFFAHGAWRDFDGILAMYHDQGLIPLKMIAAGGGVNVTAGLPFVRTSPDHGTAFGIAGQGKADARACSEALIMAVSIARSRRQIAMA